MTHPGLLADPAGVRCLDEDSAPDDPFTSLRFHFGMLLGVDDFETEKAYHRGRLRLHNGWLHGAGVVWGLGVSLDQVRSEVRVEPGLALDGAGRELHLDAAACLDPGAWFDRHEDEVTPAETPPAGADVAFDAHVEARWASCLTRPVPALAEPCEDARVDSAYSRVYETIDLRLVPGLAPGRPERHRRVRILLGLLAPGPDAADQEAADTRAAVLATAPGDRPTAALAAVRAMTSADARDSGPPDPGDGPRALTPEAPPGPVVLADLRGIALRRRAEGEGWELVGGEVDLAPRRSHVATETVQELAVAALASEGGGGGATVTGVSRTGSDLVLALSAPLDPRTVQRAAFTVAQLGAGGWEDVAITAAAHDETVPSVTLALAAEPVAPWLVLARGTGPAPLLDAELQPLGGGTDFTHLERS